jgi:hypothetical protein
MLKDGRRAGRPARGTSFRFQNLIVCRAGWTPPCGILDSTFLGPRFPWRAFFCPNKEATETDFPFLNLSLQQGMRTFPPCAFSTSMLSGGPPIFERGAATAHHRPRDRPADRADHHRRQGTQLSSTDAGAIYVFDEAAQEFRLRATYGMDVDHRRDQEWSHGHRRDSDRHCCSAAHETPLCSPALAGR